MFQLNISIIEANNLPDLFKDVMTNAYCLVQLSSSDKSFATKPIFGTSAPNWEAHIVQCIDSIQDTISFLVKTKLPFGQSKTISKIELQLSDFPINEVVDFWSDMLSTETGMVSGEIHLQICISQMSSLNSLPPVSILEPQSFQNSCFIDGEEIAICCSNGKYLTLNSDNTLSANVTNISQASHFKVGILEKYMIFLMGPNKKYLSVHSPEVISVDSTELARHQIIVIMPFNAITYNLFSFQYQTYLSINSSNLIQASQSKPSTNSYFIFHPLWRDQSYFDSSTVVTLRSEQIFVSVNANGQLTKMKQITSSESFIVSTKNHVLYSFRSASTGKYLSVLHKDGSYQVTTSNRCGNSEFFYLYKLQNKENVFSIIVPNDITGLPFAAISWSPSIKLSSADIKMNEEIEINSIGKAKWRFDNNQKCFIRTSFKRYLGVSSNGKMVGTYKEKVPEAQFTIVRAEEMDSYALRGYNGKYVSTHSQKEIWCDAKIITDKETFYYFSGPNDRVQFRGKAVDKFLTSEKNLDIHCDREKGLGQESFWIQ